MRVYPDRADKVRNRGVRPSRTFIRMPVMVLICAAAAVHSAIADAGAVSVSTTRVMSHRATGVKPVGSWALGSRPASGDHPCARAISPASTTAVCMVRSMARFTVR
jgi:hypothetical protein